MAKGKNNTSASKPIEQYEHKDKDRLNNPPVGLVDSRTDNGGLKKKTYHYDPHLDPQLQWAGKAEHTSFEVPTVSLHVHERIDPYRIIESLRTKAEDTEPYQPGFWDAQKRPLREAIEFYKYKDNWSNRLVAGDSLLVMNSLLEKEGMGDSVQTVYFDPPYGIKYRSNFQPFVNKRDMADGDKDEDLTAEPEMIKAFRDTWELGIHSYLAYIRDRLKLARNLLTPSGSIFVQISDENMHYVKMVLDEVFGRENKVATIAWKKGAPVSKLMRNSFNYLLWYAKEKDAVKPRKLYEDRIGDEGTTDDPKKLALWGEFQDRSFRTLTTDEKRNLRGLPPGTKIFRSDKLFYRGGERVFPIQLNGREYKPNQGFHWRGDEGQMRRLLTTNRLIETPDGIAYKFYVSDYPIIEVTNWWDDTSGKIPEMIYAVQTHHKIIERSILLSSDPGDLVLDITCGSGTSAFSAEKLGRRWITCDTSRVAITLAKQRLLSALFDYYELSVPAEGVGSGFVYRDAPHITLGSIGNNEELDTIVGVYQAGYETRLGECGIENARRKIWEYQYDLEDLKASLSETDLERVSAYVDEYLATVNESNRRQSSGETLYDRPLVDPKRLRVCGPFTTEAVPAPYAKSPDEDVLRGDLADEKGADNSIARSGETLRQSEWIDRLKDGIRGKGGARIEFIRVEALGGTHFLQAEAETREEEPKRVVICFGPEHAPMEQRLVEQALAEAKSLMPKPEIVLFCAFQFDPEARKDIDETNWPGIQLLEAQMDSDLQTDDLKKQPRDKTNPAFWLIGQPDVEAKKQKDGAYTVEVRGFDYYNPKTGQVESGGKADIAMWMLDPDYDDRSLFPTQVFFPMAGHKDGWSKLARNLKAEIDEEKIEAFRGTVSLPFKPGRKIAVKIIDARGIESLKIIHL